MVVTTCPFAIPTAAPNNGIGAVGWISIIPYSTRDDSPRTRFKPGPLLEDVCGLLIILIGLIIDCR
jgi:hypothetical protein